MNEKVTDGGNSLQAEFLSSPDPTMASLPFSEAVRLGNLLFVSGQLGSLPGSTILAPGGIAAEAEQAMLNMEHVLERHGSSLANVVKCTVFLADMAEWKAFNNVYRRSFAIGRFPARSALGANGLAMNARVELECIAYIP